MTFWQNTTMKGGLDKNLAGRDMECREGKPKANYCLAFHPRPVLHASSDNMNPKAGHLNIGLYYVRCA